MKYVTIILCLFCFISCKNQEKEPETNVEEHTIEDVGFKPDNAHNSQNSLDWAGEYKGTLSCEDCEGIETRILLQQDLGYELSQNYIGRSETHVSINETGEFKWDKQGNTISLGKHQKFYFQVGENYLLQLFEDGTKVMGDSAMKYRLTKINNL
ncbi:copper resistance protein NlpE [Salegentibacter maritimus]|uniref:Copper resistance protein NlpE N-terminal domain-containing protein n=1 Tax=Salegentibacter maritimus TaxID=2794347 RepID=A0ABS0TEF4_9FLAO|nr:copper resistance protein NlpE [Salegentibacter maritimus]MBI6119413.1 copper resistance protein NlpE N-terminal domain-containing protein [Salegentibacter maritimus]